MALVRKILEATIPSGGSSATFTDSDIPNSLIRVYSTNSNIYPQNISLAGNTLTVTYEAVTSSMGVAVEIVKQGLEIVDALNSVDTDKALSAKQGYVLKGLIDNIVIPTVPENITDLDDVVVNDIEDGQVLAWDEETEKFVNVDQSNDKGVIYSTTEKLTGKWIDNHDIVTVVYDLGSDTYILSTAWFPTDIVPTNVQNIISIRGTNSTGTYYPLMGYITNDAKLALLACRDGNPAVVRWLIVEYVKTS